MGMAKPFKNLIKDFPKERQERIEAQKIQKHPICSNCGGPHEYDPERACYCPYCFCSYVFIRNGRCECGGCHARGPRGTSDLDMIARWNRRHK